MRIRAHGIDELRNVVETTRESFEHVLTHGSDIPTMRLAVDDPTQAAVASARAKVRGGHLRRDVDQLADERRQLVLTPLLYDRVAGQDPANLPPSVMETMAKQRAIAARGKPIADRILVRCHKRTRFIVA